MCAKTATRWALVGVISLLGLLPAAELGSSHPGEVGAWFQASGPTLSPGGREETPRAPAQLNLEQRADIFMARKDYADAVNYYSRALKQADYSDARLWNKLGIAYQQELNFRAARNAYNQAIRRRKDMPEPWNNLGTTFFLDNRFRKSLRYYQRAVQLDPNSPSFHLNLGTTYFRLKKHQEGLEEYRAALTLDPNCLTEHSATGTVVQARGGDVEFFFTMAKIFASLGKTEEAVRFLRRAFEDGFKDQKRLDEDPDFQKISQEPAYVELMKNLPAPIKD